jgi:hypothetical protein
LCEIVGRQRAGEADTRRRVSGRAYTAPARRNRTRYMRDAAGCLGELDADAGPAAGAAAAAARCEHAMSAVQWLLCAVVSLTAAAGRSMYELNDFQPVRAERAVATRRGSRRPPTDRRTTRTVLSLLRRPPARARASRRGILRSSAHAAGLRGSLRGSAAAVARC